MKSPASRCCGSGSAIASATAAARSSATAGRHRRSTRLKPDHWPDEYTKDLLDLLNVLGRLVALEPRQADLLTRICDGPLIHASDIHDLLELSTESPQKKKRG